MDNEETRLAFTDAIRQARPDMIITHAPEDYHPDHLMAGELVFTASFLSGLPNIVTDQPAHLVVPPIYYMDTQMSLSSWSFTLASVGCSVGWPMPKGSGRRTSGHARLRGGFCHELDVSDARLRDPLSSTTGRSLP